jgi:hypothetical protein
MRAMTRWGWAATGLGLLVAAGGCRVEKHDGRDGKSGDVSIQTPIAGLTVRHDANAASIGLPTYPGATEVKGDDGDSANVHLGFGQWQLRVQALKYRTPDAPDKVESFYRKPLSQYGVVLTCRDGKPVGTPTMTNEGLECGDNGPNQVGTHINFSDSDELELRTGSKHRQHIVSIKQIGGGTEMTLVELELPRNLPHKDSAE